MPQRKCVTGMCVIGCIGGIEVPQDKWDHELHHMNEKIKHYQTCPDEVTDPGTVVKYENCPLCGKAVIHSNA